MPVRNRNRWPANAKAASVYLRDAQAHLFERFPEARQPLPRIAEVADVREAIRILDAVNLLVCVGKVEEGLSR